jgi:hypothetical protein
VKEAAAIIYFLNREYDNCLAWCDDVINLGIQSSSIWMLKGDCHREKNNYNFAFWAYRKAMELNSNAVKALNQNDRVYRRILPVYIK